MVAKNLIFKNCNADLLTERNPVISSSRIICQPKLLKSEMMKHQPNLVLLYKGEGGGGKLLREFIGDNEWCISDHTACQVEALQTQYFPFINSSNFDNRLHIVN